MKKFQDCNNIVKLWRLRWYLMIPVWTFWWAWNDIHQAFTLRNWWHMATGMAQAKMMWLHDCIEIDSSAAYNDSNYPKEF